MLSEHVQEIVTLQNDMNAKAFLLIVIAIYMAFAFWRYDKVEFDSLTNKIYKLSLFIYSRVTLFFYPLMVVNFMHINTSLEEMIIFIVAMYGIIMVGTLGFLIIKGFENVLDMLGIDKGGAYK